MRSLPTLSPLTPHTRFLSRTVDSALLGCNAFFAGMWLDQPVLQATGISMAALSPLIAKLLRTGATPAERRPPEHDVETRAHHHFLETYEIAQARALELNPEVNRLDGAVPTKNARFRALLDGMEEPLWTSLAPILLLGPSGSGKSELARQMHEVRKLAGLATGDFVEVNCAELAAEPNLTSLFGHTRGAFTGAENARAGLLYLARGGTLFFDEIGELNLAQQAVLLTLMNKKTYRPMGQSALETTDATFMFATLRDLPAMIAAGEFRFDLWQRINTFTYTLPGLAERPEDFDALLDFTVEVKERTYDMVVTFEPDARAAYLAVCRSTRATWPGNLRALASSVERLVSNTARRVDMARVEAEAQVLAAEWAAAERALAGAGAAAPAALAAPAGAPVAAPARVAAPLAASVAPMGAEERDAVEEAELPPSVRGKLFRPDRAEALVYVRACRDYPNIGDAAEFVWHAEPDTSRKMKADRLRRMLSKYGLTYETARER